MRHPSASLFSGMTLPRLLGVVLTYLLGMGSVPAEGTTVKHRDVVDLIALSEVILVGTVISVTDGFDHDLPFTEVTLTVAETLRGVAGSSYTFRQFGLLAPRPTADGRSRLSVSPDGWPRFKTGEEVFLFLYKKGSATGLRTTVGLLQGKFTRVDGGFVNEIANQGLFHKVWVSPALLTPTEQKMLKVKIGALDPSTFVSFVRRAIENRWIENGKLDHVR